MLRTPEKTRRVLQEKIEDCPSLPTIVRATVNTSTADWPETSAPLDNTDREDESRAIFREFEEKYQYERVWHNDAFEILRTDQSNTCSPGLNSAAIS